MNNKAINIKDEDLTPIEEGEVLYPSFPWTDKSKDKRDDDQIYHDHLEINGRESFAPDLSEGYSH